MEELPAPIVEEVEPPESLELDAEGSSEAMPEDLSEEELAAPVGDDGPLPDWLKSVGELPLAERSARETGVTEWLRSLDDEPVPDEIIPEEPPPEEEVVPDWFEEIDLAQPTLPSSSLAEDDGAVEIPDWLQESPAEEVFGSLLPEELPALEPGEPGWLEGLAGEEELVAGEPPAWVAELRPKESEVEEDVPVETSGPLVGLKGLLNPEPVLGILPKSTYKPLPPIPESHHSEAKRIEQLLSTPAGRSVAVSESPGREIMATLGRWVLYGMLVVVICAAAFLPPEVQDLIQPPETSETKAFYNLVESLPARSKVLLVFDYDASLDGELTPQARVIAWHLLYKNLDVAVLGLTPQGSAISRDLGQDMKSLAGGTFVNLGYLPPHPASVQTFVDNPAAGATLFAETNGSDRPGAEAPFRDLNDLALIITVSGTQEHVRWWIEQVGSRRQIDIVAGVSAAIAPYLQPYYGDMSSGQLKGMLVGLSGAAQYEKLSGALFSPNARENFVLQGYAQLLFVAVVILGGANSLLRSLLKRNSERTGGHSSSTRSSAGGAK